jgi:DNA-binding PadR family transcriptional regulator
MAINSKQNPPLSSATLHILLALAGGDLHGYGIIQEIISNSEGNYRVGPGTLYDNLKKLMDAGWVTDVRKSPSSKAGSSSSKEDDRRFYTLTKEGRVVFATEVERLQNVVKVAKLRLQESRPGRA